MSLYDEAIQACQSGRFDNENKRKRFNLLCQLASEATRRFPRLPIVQVGVWHGHSTYMLAKTCPRTEIIAIDSFEGLQDFQLEDGNKETSEKEFLKNHFTAHYESARKALATCKNVILFKHNINDLFGYGSRYCLTAIDVDLYKPTFSALKQFEPSTRGVVYVDDYGYKDFPGATEAVRKYYRSIQTEGYMVPQEYGSIAIIKG